MANHSDYNKYYRPPPGNYYRPSGMEFNGTTDYYGKANVSISGNLQTTMFRFKIASFTGASSVYPFRCQDAGSNYDRMSMYILASDHALTNRRNKLHLVSDDSSNVRKVQLISKNNICDDEWHTCFMAIDAGNGAAIFRIDGEDADDTSHGDRVAPSVYTMHTGNQNISVCSSAWSGVLNSEAMDIGYFGMDDQYLDWQDFMDRKGNPKKQDESTWANSGFGSQPILWNEYGMMDDNKGSAGNLTKNGTPDLGPLSAIDPADYVGG